MRSSARVPRLERFPRPGRHKSLGGRSVAVSQPIVSGKFLEVEGERFLIRGVSYGTFAPAGMFQFPAPDRIAADCRAIAALGGNTVRTYTPPSLRLLDEAARCGLRVIVGVPWSQHTAFLDSPRTVAAIRSEIRRQVERCAVHPATLMFALGNEIPPGIVRWHGRRKIERFLADLCDEARSASPRSLLTYVNYPPTEYLDTSCFDVCAFNVFLHREADLTAYLARLHNVAGPRPLLVSEAGADSLRHGEERQSALLMMQLRTAFSEGACGAIVFSWTDDWWRGGHQIDDWAFGLVDAERQPKRSYHVVQRVFQSAPFHDDQRATWPRVSVIVCAYNAARTLGECLKSLDDLHYPDFEVIVVDDGSTDATRAIAAAHAKVRVISIENGGLAAARNVGLSQATGEIVAYTDADVIVDHDWLTYLVQPFLNSNVVAAGGPNVVPPHDGWMAQCVARAPGGPTHVLLDDRIAEHVPGCNCAFRRDALAAINGFNPIFLRAGDDVDVCWRLQAMGWKIAFAPSALVWHHHRDTIAGYWRQQVGYGEGETWLMRSHPEQFVRGRMAWRGHIYSPLPLIRSFSDERIHAGPFGAAAFPSVYRTYAHPLTYLPHSGRWQLAWLALLVAAFAAWPAAPAYAGALATASLLLGGVTMARCAAHGLRSDVRRLPPIGDRSRQASRVRYCAAIATLHFLQPFARLHGRLKGMLTAPPSLTRDRHEHHHGRAAWADALEGLRLFLRRPIERALWSEQWIEARTLVVAIADRLRRQRIVKNVELDSGWWEDRDLTMVDHAWFKVDVRTVVEDHGDGRCLCRLAMRSRMTATLPAALVSGGAAITVLQRAGLIGWPAGAAVVALWTIVLPVVDMSIAARVLSRAINGVAAELGLMPIERGTDRSRTADAAPHPGRPQHAPARATPLGAVPGSFTREPAGGMVPIAVMQLDKPNL